MRAFVMALIAFVALGTAGYFILDSGQEASGAAFATGRARIAPGWSWRSTSVVRQQDCTPRKSWQWFFVDFRDPAGESKLCSDSQ